MVDSSAAWAEELPFVHPNATHYKYENNTISVTIYAVWRDLTDGRNDRLLAAIPATGENVL